MIKQHKKGYALLTTMAVMVVIMALASLLFAYATSMNHSANRTKKSFNSQYEITQIAQNFIDNTQEDFEAKYPTYIRTTNGSTTILSGEKYDLELTSEENVLTLTINENSKVLAELQKENNILIKYLKNN